MWYKKEKGEVSWYDLLELRKLSKTVLFCQGVDEEQLDMIIIILFDEVKLERQQKCDIIAAISNILLINRNIHMEYFIPKYAGKLSNYCVELISNEFMIDNCKFEQLIPIYRMIFLSMYGGLDKGIETLELLLTLTSSLAYCMKIIDKEYKTQYFQLLLVEILKCFYTLYHKEDQGPNNILFDDCLHIINTFSNIESLSDTEKLVIKNAYSFLLLLCGDSENIIIRPTYTGDCELYKSFFSNVKTQLESLLVILESASAKEKTDNYPLFVNLIVVLKYLSRQLVEQLKTLPSDKFYELHKTLCDVILPSKNCNYIYNQFLQILAVLAFPNLGFNHSFAQLQQLGFIKDGIVSILYDCCYNKDRSVHHKLFFELVGFLNSDMFMEKNNYQIDPSVKLLELTDPISEYLDKEAYFAKKLDYLSDKRVETNDTNSIDDMTEEEKEREAERLFVLFERMEKLGTFGNFKNPIKQWQQEGKFEEIRE